MKYFLRNIFLSTLTVLVLGHSALFAQYENIEGRTLEKTEASMLKVIDSMAASNDVLLRNKLSEELVLMFYHALDSKEAMEYPFDKLYAISDLRSDDHSFRIVTWELENDEGDIEYHGVAAYEEGNRVIAEVLEDGSSDIQNPEFKTLKSKNWYGALYYDVRKYMNKKDVQYVLLGINRNEQLLKKRIIEIAFVDDELQFGKEVFDVNGKIGLKRRVFEHSVEAEMSILFDDEDDRIVMDHLSPLQPVYQNNHQYYVPDLSFDALEYNKGIWHYKSDVDVKMKEDYKDNFQDADLPKQKKVY